MEFYKNVYNICDEIYKNETKINQGDKKKSEFNFCYLIESSTFDEFKTNINYNELKKCVEDKRLYPNFNKAEKFIENKLKHNKQELLKIENNKIEQFKNSKELIDKLFDENKKYNLINSTLKRLISENQEEDKKIQFYIKGKILHLLFNKKDIIKFNFNKGIIAKSSLFEQKENIPSINKNNKEEEKKIILYDNLMKDIKIKYKKNIEILIRYYFYYKELKKKENDSFKEIVENKKETVYLINNKWIENYKTTFDYNILEKTLSEFEKRNNVFSISDENINKILTILPYEYFNKIVLLNKNIDKNIDMIQSKTEKKNNRILKFLFDFQIINSQIYGLLIQLEYNCNISQKLDFYYLSHNKIFLKFPNEISKNCDEIGFINEQNIFIPEYILFYENDIGIQNLNLFFKNNFFVNSNNKDFEIIDDKNKIIGNCYSLSSFNENNENSTNDNNSENINNKNQNEIQGNDNINTTDLTDNNNDNNLNIQNQSNNIKEEDAHQSQDNINNNEINSNEENSLKNQIKKEEEGEIQSKIEIILLLHKFEEEINNKIKKSSEIEEFNIEEGFIIKKEIIDEFEKKHITEDIENYLKNQKLTDNMIDIQYIYSNISDKKKYLEKINEEINIINNDLYEHTHVEDNNEDIYFPKNFYIVNKNIFSKLNKDFIPDIFNENEYAIQYIINNGKIIFTYNYYLTKEKIYYYILICEKNENNQYEIRVIISFDNNKEKRDIEFEKYKKNKIHLNPIENTVVIENGILLKRPLQEEYANSNKLILIEIFIEINLFNNILKEKIENNEDHCYIVNKNWMTQFLEFFQYNQFISIVKEGNIDFEKIYNFKNIKDDFIESLAKGKMINDKIKQKNNFVNVTYTLGYKQKNFGEESISYYDDFMIINKKIKDLIFKLLKIEFKEERKILIKDDKVYIEFNEKSILIGKFDEKFVYHTEIVFKFKDNKFINHYFNIFSKNSFQNIIKAFCKSKNKDDILEIKSSSGEKRGFAYIINFDIKSINPEENNIENNNSTINLKNEGEKIKINKPNKEGEEVEEGEAKEKKEKWKKERKKMKKDKNCPKR